MTQSEVALAAARQQFQQGALDFLNVIAAQNALLAGQDALSQANTQVSTDLVVLYRALGGGWEPIAGKAAPPAKG